MADDRGTGGKLNVFVSYSRDDLEFADQLVEGLEVTGYEVSIDRHGISGGEAWESRLGALIRAADTVTFVVSPASRSSQIVTWQVGEVARQNKRSIPVLSRPLGDALPPQKLQNLNYIFFYPEPKSPGSGFGSGLNEVRVFGARSRHRNLVGLNAGGTVKRQGSMDFSGVRFGG